VTVIDHLKISANVHWTEVNFETLILILQVMGASSGSGAGIRKCPRLQQTEQ